MNGLAILLAAGRPSALPFARTMRTDGQDVGRAIGEMNAGARGRDQHHLPREIARRVTHRLIGRGDAA